MEPLLTLSVTEFKAHCLEYIDRLDRHEIGELVLTKRGKPVAVMKPPRTTAEALRAAYGALRGSIVIAEGVDLTEPAFEGVMDAELGILHR